MWRGTGNRLKLVIGIVISAVFLWLAFRKVDIHQMGEAFQQANYWYVLPALAAIFVSHWLRALRWRYFLDPVKRIRMLPLFSALMIGYMANGFLPAHLGEVLRAYVIGKREKISGSSAFATIALERIIDVLTLLLITAFTLVLKPFPEFINIPKEVETSGYIMFAATVAFSAFLLLLKVRTDIALRLVHFILRPLPQRLLSKVERLLLDFTAGLMPLRRISDYVVVVLTSLLIWGCYAAVIFVGFFAFDFLAAYGLDFSSALIVLIITTISVVVPSSPGYVGTYHALCVLSLALYGVDRSAALSYAFVVHALNMLSVIVAGLFFAWREGLGFSKMSHREEIQLTEG